VPLDIPKVWCAEAEYKAAVCAARRRGYGVWAFSQNTLFSAKTCTRYTFAKMTFLTKCAYIAAAAQTGSFHHAVKYQTLVASRSAC
jgi:hypothetical protein